MKGKKKGGEDSTKLQQPNVEAEVNENNKKVWVKNKSLIRFHIASKIDNYNRSGGGVLGGWRRKRKKQGGFQK